MFTRLTSTVFILGFCCFFTACGGERAVQTVEQRTRPFPPDYDRSACVFQPDEGDKAANGFLAETSIMEESGFGKKYDRKDLEAILDASAVETSLYVMNLGINVYRMPRTRASLCPTYYVLPEAPDKLKSEWDRIAGSGGEGNLAGLYFESCLNNCDDWTVVSPTILVHEAADRWTLVHEMMHHNFNVQRKSDRALQSVQKNRIELVESIKRAETYQVTYISTKSKDALLSLAKEIDHISVLLYDMLINSVFEEIAVENLLIEERFADRLRFVADESSLSAAWYIGYARKDGMKRFEALNEKAYDIVLQASRNNWPDITEIIKGMQERIIEIDERTKKIENSAIEKTTTVLNPTNLTNHFYLARSKRPVFHRHIEGLESYRGVQDFDEGIQRLNTPLDIPARQ